MIRTIHPFFLILWAHILWYFYDSSLTNSVYCLLFLSRKSTMRALNGRVNSVNHIAHALPRLRPFVASPCAIIVRLIYRQTRCARMQCDLMGGNRRSHYTASTQCTQCTLDPFTISNSMVHRGKSSLLAACCLLLVVAACAVISFIPVYIFIINTQLSLVSYNAPAVAASARSETILQTSALCMYVNESVCMEQAYAYYVLLCVECLYTFSRYLRSQRARA